MQLKNKKAIVIGASGGIGEAISEALLKAGAQVCKQYRLNKPKAQEGFILLQADLASESTVQELLTNAQQKMNGLNIVVNCIGDFLFKPLYELSPEEFKKIIDSNLTLAYAICHHSAKLLRDSGEGRILNIGYATAEQLEAKPNILPYHIAKLGLVLLTKAYAQNQAQNKILVNCLSPGVVENTEAWPNTKIPLGRPAKLNEIAEAALFLLSSDYITGTNLQIDGGWRGR